MSQKHKPGGPSLESLVGVMAGFPLAYLIAEAALPGNKHPLHWFLTAVGAFCGYLVGAGVYRMKENRDLYGSFLGRASRQGAARRMRLRR